MSGGAVGSEEGEVSVHGVVEETNAVGFVVGRPRGSGADVGAGSFSAFEVVERSQIVLGEEKEEGVGGRSSLEGEEIVPGETEGGVDEAKMPGPAMQMFKDVGARVRKGVVGYRTLGVGLGIGDDASVGQSGQSFEETARFASRVWTVFEPEFGEFERDASILDGIVRSFLNNF